jgi:hypothetical protein
MPPVKPDYKMRTETPGKIKEKRGAGAGVSW